jgi:hypothetical protein
MTARAAGKEEIGDFCWRMSCVRPKQNHKCLHSEKNFKTPKCLHSEKKFETPKQKDKGSEGVVLMLQVVDVMSITRDFVILINICNEGLILSV